MAKKKLDWQFMDFEHNGETSKAMYECSDGCVQVRLFLKKKGDWSHPSTTHHVPGTDPIHMAHTLLGEIADGPQNS